MGMIDGEYWAVFAPGDGLLGVTKDLDKLNTVLVEEYIEDFERERKEPFPEDSRKRLSLMLKFDTYYLTYDGIKMPAYYAINVQEL